jgi:hypothetical protein
VAGASWFECNWWTLCAYGTYYTPFTVESSTRSITTVSLKADNPIGIKFIGQDNALVNVNSTGNLVLNGSINNRSGDTTISSAGTITQNGELPLVSGNNVFLAAGSGIGSGGQAVQVNVKDGGYPVGAYSGDTGQALNVELHHPLWSASADTAGIGASGAFFIDYGRVRPFRPPASTLPEHERLAGAGWTLLAAAGQRVQARLTFATGLKRDRLREHPYEITLQLIASAF